MSAPELEALYQQYKDQGLIVITSMTGGAAVDTLAWAETYGLTAPVVADAPANLAGEWGVSAIPSQHLIGRGGVILQTNQYHIGEETILEALAR